MKVWFSLSETAALDIAGLPKTQQGMEALSKRETWDTFSALARPREGVGGGWEYHMDLWPIWSRLAYVARHVKIEASDNRQPIVEDDTLTATARKVRDARLAILDVADRFFKETGLTLGAADDYFVSLYNDGKVELMPWVRLTVRSVSKRNLARWRATSRAAGTQKLGFDPALSRKGTGLLDRAHDGAVRWFILALISQNPQITANKIRNTVIDKFGDDLPRANGEVVPVPDERSFQRTISGWKIEYRNEILRLTDPDGYRSKVEYVATGTTRADRLNEIWQIDASPLDAMTIRGKRPTIYSCIDIYSRRMIILVTDTPRSAAVGLLLRKALIAWGVPEKIKTDNGSDFKAHYVMRLFKRLHIEYDPTRPYDPRAKGVVERSIGTFQRDFAASLPGFVGHNPGERRVLENRKAFSVRHNIDDAHMFNADMTDAEVATAADRWAEVDYAHRPHSGKTMRGRTPFDVAASYTGKVRRIESAAALDILLAPVPGKDGLRKVGHQGIRIAQEHYILGSVMVGDTVFCRMDPTDLGRLYVFAQDEETFIGVAVCPDLLGLDPVATAMQARAQQKAFEDPRIASIRKASRKIGPRDVLHAQQKAADKRAGNLVAFPQRGQNHSTPALAAALDAVTPRKPAELSARGQAEQDRLIAQAEAPGERVERMLDDRMTSIEAARVAHLPTGGNVVALPETAIDRYRRAVLIMAQVAAGDQDVPAIDGIWAARYEASSEFKAQARMHAEYGAQYLEV